MAVVPIISVTPFIPLLTIPPLLAAGAEREAQEAAAKSTGSSMAQNTTLDYGPKNPQSPPQAGLSVSEIVGITVSILVIFLSIMFVWYLLRCLIKRSGRKRSLVLPNPPSDINTLPKKAKKATKDKKVGPAEGAPLVFPPSPPPSYHAPGGMGREDWGDGLHVV